MIIYNKIETYLEKSNCNKNIWIIDKNVFDLWQDRLNYLVTNNLYYIFESTEENKTMDSYNKIIDFLFENNVDRSFTIIGLGGGIVGDLTGFIASTYLRGIKLIHFPTTLLSMVDSSIGGKTGVNNIYGKNMIGSIYQAKDIVIDISWLESLSEEQKTNGMAEVIKMALIKGGKLYQLIQDSNPDTWENLEEMIKLSANYKIDIIEDDERDTKGCRELLNLGHTWGHGYELSQHILHGYAVADGIIEELKYSHYYYNFPSLGTIKKVLDLLKKWKLLKESKNLSFNRFDKNYETRLIYFYMSKDKKENRLVTLRDIGKPEIVTWTIDNWKFINSKYFKLKNNQILTNTDDLTKLEVPSSKSVTNRALICGLIASNFSQMEFTIENILESEDTELMISALKQSHVKLEQNNSKIKINPSRIKPNGKYYLGNSGTSVRFLLPILAMTTKEEITIDGSEDMRKRPIGPLVKSLIKFGCKIDDKEYLPIKIYPSNVEKNITNIAYIDGSLSSQYVTGLILAFSLQKCYYPSTKYIVKVEGTDTSCGFIRMTIKMLKTFGVSINNVNKIFTLDQIDVVKNSTYIVEADATTASYIFGWSFLNKFNLQLNNFNLKSVQPDSDVLQRMLLHFGDLEQLGNKVIFKPFDSIKNFINDSIFDLDSSDTFLTWAALFYSQNKQVEFTNIENQNWKECARIDRFLENVKKIGGECIKTETGFKIYNTTVKNNNVVIETEKDHRLAMSFSLLSMKYENILIKNPHCVNKTYPKYWEDIKKIGVKIIPTDKLYSRTISLIGMPGSGKTELAFELGNKLNIKCFDIDKMIESEMGNIKELINKNGWQSFRDIESKQIFESLIDDEMKVISTGGGAIENNNSRNFLDNSVVIWVKREADKEVIERRKLEDSYKNLAIKRNNIYEALSDFVYYNDKTPYDFVKWIRLVLFSNPIPLTSTFLCKQDINYEENISNYVEFRGDLIHDYKKIQDLMIKFERPCIFTLRSKSEGGKFEGTEYDYCKLNKLAIKYGARIIDNEINGTINSKANLHFNNENVKVIGSVHSDNLSFIKTNCNKFNAEILKIVTTEENCLELNNMMPQNQYILIDNQEGKFRTLNKFMTPISSCISEAVAPGQLDYIKYLDLSFKNYSQNYIFLFGSNIGESPSCFIHNEVISKYFPSINYLNFETTNENNLIELINKPYFLGASVTMPFKEKLSQKFIGEEKAINTVKKINGLISFENTDTLAIKFFLNKMKTIILGTGGAAIGAIEAVSNKKDIILLGRDKQKLKYLSKKYSIITKHFDDTESILPTDEKYQLINCLPPSVSIREYINKNCYLIDMSYGLHNLLKNNVPNEINGYDILYVQAAYQFMFWFKDKISEDKINTILEEYGIAMDKFLRIKYNYLYIEV